MTEIGLISIASSLGFVFFEPTFGYISDRIGRKKILFGATLVSGATTFFYTMVTSFWHFLPISFFSTAVFSGVVVTRRAFIADVMGSSERGKRYGTYMAWFTLGEVAGPFLGGYLAEITNHITPFYVSCLIMLLSAVIVLLIKEVRLDDSMGVNDVYSRKNVEKVSPTKSHSSLRLVTSGFVMFLITRMLQSFVGFFLRSILPIFAKESEELNATESQIGLMMSIVSVTRVPLQLVFGDLADRIGRKLLITLGALFGGLTFFGFQTISSIPQLYTMRTLYGVCAVSFNLAMMIYLIDCIPREKYGIAMGLYGLSEDVGGMLGPLIIAFFYDNQGFTASVYCVSGVMLLGAVTSMVSFKRFKSIPAPSTS